MGRVCGKEAGGSAKGGRSVVHGGDSPTSEEPMGVQNLGHYIQVSPFTPDTNMWVGVGGPLGFPTLTPLVPRMVQNRPKMAKIGPNQVMLTACTSSGLSGVNYISV